MPPAVSSGASSLDQAMSHINHYGSQHTDSIVTENLDNARRFLREVDSSSVMVNASTRFADGFEFGLGAGITGIGQAAHFGHLAGKKIRHSQR